MPRSVAPAAGGFPPSGSGVGSAGGTTAGPRPGRTRRAAIWSARLLPLALLVLAACQGEPDDPPTPRADDGVEEGADAEEDAERDAQRPPRPRGADVEREPMADAPVPIHARNPDRAERADRLAAWRDALDDDAARLGQLLTLRVFGGAIDESDPRNEALYGVATPREVVERFRPGGILMFRTDAGEDTGNLRHPHQVRAFTDDLREVSEELGPPVTVAVDQEGGPVDRIGHFGTPYPAARELAGDPDAAAEHAEVTVTELAALGIDMNFAPVADVDSEPGNPVIGDRAYSGNPESVADMVVAQLGHYRDRGVVPVLKHFPGHGDTTRDSHHTLPTVDADRDILEQRELVPFARAIDAGAQAIMTAHLHLPKLSGAEPASMSRAVVTDLLRGELGFDGLVVTDSLEMEGARQNRSDDRVALHALLAGHDLLVLPPSPRESLTTLERALSSRQLEEERVEASVDRILRLKASTHDERTKRPDPDVVGRTGECLAGKPPGRRPLTCP